MLTRFFGKQAKPCEFVDWLRFANPGMLEPGNIYCIEYAIEHLPSCNPVIEIGSFCGLSTNLIGFYLQKNRKKNRLITSDKWIFEGGEHQEKQLEGTSITHAEYRNFVKESYIRNISFFSREHLPYTIETFSDDFFTLWKAGSTEIDVLGRETHLGGPLSFSMIRRTEAAGAYARSLMRSSITAGMKLSPPIRTIW
ncbi:MAG: hypothetical protein LBD67_08440 [Candidatus Accumulibacter sp.]|nr:hypothetical protein [Accumulibacter sp.]